MVDDSQFINSEEDEPVGNDVEKIDLVSSEIKKNREEKIKNWEKVEAQHGSETARVWRQMENLENINLEKIVTTLSERVETFENNVKKAEIFLKREEIHKKLKGLKVASTLSFDKKISGNIDQLAQRQESVAADEGKVMELQKKLADLEMDHMTELYYMTQQNIPEHIEENQNKIGEIGEIFDSKTGELNEDLKDMVDKGIFKFEKENLQKYMHGEVSECINRLADDEGKHYFHSASMTILMKEAFSRFQDSILQELKGEYPENESLKILENIYKKINIPTILEQVGMIHDAGKGIDNVYLTLFNIGNCPLLGKETSSSESEKKMAKTFPYAAGNVINLINKQKAIDFVNSRDLSILSDADKEKVITQIKLIEPDVDVDKALDFIKLSQKFSIEDTEKIQNQIVDVKSDEDLAQLIDGMGDKFKEKHGANFKEKYVHIPSNIKDINEILSGVENSEEIDFIPETENKKFFGGMRKLVWDAHAKEGLNLLVSIHGKEMLEKIGQTVSEEENSNISVMTKKIAKVAEKIFKEKMVSDSDSELSEDEQEFLNTFFVLMITGDHHSLQGDPYDFVNKNIEDEGVKGAIQMIASLAAFADTNESASTRPHRETEKNAIGFSETMDCLSDQRGWTMTGLSYKKMSKEMKSVLAVMIEKLYGCEPTFEEGSNLISKEDMVKAQRIGHEPKLETLLKYMKKGAM